MVTRRFFAAGGAGIGELVAFALVVSVVVGPVVVVVVVVLIVMVGGERVAGWGGMVLAGWEWDWWCGGGGGGYESWSSISSSSSSLTRTSRGDLLQCTHQDTCNQWSREKTKQRGGDEKSAQPGRTDLERSSPRGVLDAD